MSDSGTKIAEFLLKIKAVRLSPSDPFTWASGMKSPIYCDNRLSLSYPEVRETICASFCDLIREKMPTASAVAGVATAGIPHGMLVADRLGLPFIYVRSSPKGHGLGNQIEGRLDPEMPYAVIEDLVSTGGSSLKAVEAIREAGGQAAGLVSVFSYGFDAAAEAFQNAGLPAWSLTNLEELLRVAAEKAYIQTADLETIRSWRKDPKNWVPASGVAGRS